MDGAAHTLQVTGNLMSCALVAIRFMRGFVVGRGLGQKDLYI